MVLEINGYIPTFCGLGTAMSWPREREDRGAARLPFLSGRASPCCLAGRCLVGCPLPLGWLACLL
jgi:hypothetical protein